MKLALHAGCVMYTNVITDIRVAREAGYDGIELWIPKLKRYLEAGFSAAEAAASLGPLQVTMLDTILPVEAADAATRARVIDDCSRMAEVAAVLRCPALQVVALDHFDTDDWPAQRRTLVASLNELADIAHARGVRLALEPVTFSRFRSLSQALEVIDAVGSSRIGLCLDTWHLWTSGTPWEEVAALDRDLIVCVHISDTHPKTGAGWRDEDRTALPGDGILPLPLGIEAIRATGYDGVWSVEMLSRRHWEWDPEVLAAELLSRARALLAPAAA
jgi:sugar phosphate isomerase/epimerase